MTRLRILALFLATLIVVATKSISMDAQTTTQASPFETSKSATISLSIAVPNKQIPMAQKPWVHLTVKNLGSEKIAYPRERIHVEGPECEPPTTLVQRSIKGRLNPGEAQFLPPDFDRPSQLEPPLR